MAKKEVITIQETPKQENFELKVELLSPMAVMPKKANQFDAGFDLATPNAFSIAAGEVKAINLNIKVQIPTGYCGLVCSRSGLATKRGIVSHIAPGVIDSGYRGEVIAVVRNVGNSAQNFGAGDRIAQLVLVSIPLLNAVEVSSLDETDRGEGGFGSSGK